MAHGRQQFTLVGYSEVLERRSLKFVDPIPASRICSACGNVPRMTYSLLCGHTFCEPCYESCATTSDCVCPLDGVAYASGDVSSKEYPAEELLRRKVHCWNEAYGCGVVLPASQIAEHAHHDCKNHVSRCPNCSADVLSHDMCVHLKSRCTALVVHTAPEAPQVANNNENAQFVALERQVEQRVRELDARLAQLSFESGSHNDKLVEVCHNINYLKEAQAEQFGALAEKFERALAAHEKKIEERVGELLAKLAQLPLDSGSQSDKPVDFGQHITNLKEVLTQQFEPALDRNAAKINSLYTKKTESLITAIHAVLMWVLSDRTTHHWALKGYAALKEQALKSGRSLGMSDEVFLSRYLMSWGMLFIKEGDSVYLLLRIQLHEGVADDFLAWPFANKLKLSIIHPETREELHRVGTPVLCQRNSKSFRRPIGRSNRPVRFFGTKIETRDIESDGYVKRDCLLLRLEVL